MSIQADPNEFAGKRVLISGGTKGLGRATLQRFLAGGARVVTAARTIKDRIEGVAYVQADLTTAEGSEALGTVDKVDSQISRSVIQDCLLGGG
ncbi:hypothetical protein SB748_29485, partial [Rhizobium sp. SIMBA_035]